MINFDSELILPTVFGLVKLHGMLLEPKETTLLTYNIFQDEYLMLEVNYI
jgi:hypothetical protein